MAAPAPEVAAAPPAEAPPTMAAPAPEVATAPTAEAPPTMAAPAPEVATAPPVEAPPTVAAPAPEVATAPAETPPTMAAPAPEVATAPATETPPTMAAPAGPQVAMAEPPPAESPATPAVAPTFDVVRVERSGEAVVAGLAAPGAKVEVLDGANAVATAEANNRGEWALALDKPLPPGTHDLAIRTTSDDKKVTTLSDQRVAVSVPDDKSNDVLVVLNSPDAPSKVLQIPAAKPPEAAPASATPEPAGPAVAEAAPAETPAPATPAPEVAAAPAPAETQPATPPAPEVAMAEPEKTGAAPASPPAAAQPEVSVAPATPAEPSAPPAGASEVASAPAAPAQPEPAPEPAGPKAAVTVAAVEADTAGGLFVAGTAETDEPVRVYVENQPIGETTPTEGGTWLVETKREMPAGTYQVRADQVDKKTGDVIARAEVSFEREIQVASLKPVVTASAAGAPEVTGQMPEMQTVIIKRGDNLWHIARDLYGRGIRYSTIYQANREQIRNPHWIYPGQVFVVPAGNTDWQK